MICKMVKVASTLTSETISSESRIKKEKWIVYGIYRPPQKLNLNTVSQDLTFSLNKHLNIYEDIIIH